MLIKASQEGIISRVLPNVVPGGIISLQYTDDTLLFLDPSLENARNMKWLLSCFHRLSGMKINFNKCDMKPLNVEEDNFKMLAQFFCCKQSSFPLKYLFVPLHFAKLRREDLHLLLIKLSRGSVVGGENYLAMKLNWFFFMLVLLVYLHT